MSTPAFERMITSIKETYEVDTAAGLPFTVMDADPILEFDKWPERCVSIKISKQMVHNLLYEEAAYALRDHDDSDDLSYASDLFWSLMQDVCDSKRSLDEAKDVVAGKKHIKYEVVLRLDRVLKAITSFIFKDVFGYGDDILPDIMLPKNRDLMAQWKDEETDTIEFYVSMSIKLFGDLGLTCCRNHHVRFNAILEGELKEFAFQEEIEYTEDSLSDMLTDIWISSLPTYHPEWMEVCDLKVLIEDTEIDNC